MSSYSFKDGKLGALFVNPAPGVWFAKYQSGVLGQVSAFRFMLITGIWHGHGLLTYITVVRLPTVCTVVQNCC